MRASLALLLLALPACDVTRKVTETIGEVLLTPEQEQQLGADMARQVEAQEPVHADDGVQAFLDGVAARTLAEVPADEKEFPFEFTVLDVPDQVNAFALPGGHIYFYSGLICRAETEAEVAAVMGHEIAHVTQGHVSQHLAAQVGTDLLLAMALGQDPGAIEQLAGQIAQQGYLASYSRDSESEADRVGLRYVADAGWNPAAMATFFEKLAALGAGSAGLESFFASHPDPDDRAVEVRSIIQSEMLGGGEDELVGGFDAIRPALNCP